MFQRVMTAISETFGTDLIFRRQDLPSRSRLHQLAQDIAAGATVENTSIPLVQFAAIRDEIVWMVVTLLMDAFGPMLSQPSTTQCAHFDHDRRDDVDDDFHTPEQQRRRSSDYPPHTGGSSIGLT